MFLNIFINNFFFSFKDWGYKYTEEILCKNVNFNLSILNALYKVIKVE
jgi:hypothetical protein